MTVNIALVTNDAIVFGADSIASTVGYMLDPFACGIQSKEDGTLSVDFTDDSIQPVVTSAWGGVTKMFQIHDGETPVAAITAGLAKFAGQTMSSLAHDFKVKQDLRKQTRANVSAVVKDFAVFLQKKYLAHYKGSPLDPRFRDGPEFLVGGYGRKDAFPSLYKIRVKENAIDPVYESGEVGISWNGQSSAVERFLRGYDFELYRHIQRQHDAILTDLQDQIGDKVKTVFEGLTNNGVELPADFKLDLTPKKTKQLDWGGIEPKIYVGALPLQAAIDLTAHLVNIQSGLARFEHGVATVGGRTHVGVMTKKDGFKMLNESELAHRNTGFGDD